MKDLLLLIYWVQILLGVVITITNLSSSVQKFLDEVFSYMIVFPIVIVPFVVLNVFLFELVTKKFFERSGRYKVLAIVATLTALSLLSFSMWLLYVDEPRRTYELQQEMDQSYQAEQQAKEVCEQSTKEKCSPIECKYEHVNEGPEGVCWTVKNN